MSPKGLLFSPCPEPDWDAEARRYREKLRGRPDVLAHVSPQAMELARQEFRTMPERAGQPIAGRVSRPLQ